MEGTPRSDGFGIIIIGIECHNLGSRGYHRSIGVIVYQGTAIQFEQLKIIQSQQGIVVGMRLLMHNPPDYASTGPGVAHQPDLFAVQGGTVGGIPERTAAVGGRQQDIGSHQCGTTVGVTPVGKVGKVGRVGAVAVFQKECFGVDVF